MTTKTPQPLTRKPLLLTGAGLATLALLTGCATNGDDTGAPPAEEVTTPAPDTAETSPATDPAPDQTSPAPGEDTAPAEDTASPTDTGDTTSPTAGDTAAGDTDAVFAAIGTVLSEHSEGIITAIDREDDRDEYEVDVVVGNEVIELDVLEDGTVREDDRDSDDEDDVREAEQADVTAEDAIRTALEGRDGQILDQAELDEDDGTLHWEIELDRTEGGDGDEVRVDAMSGEIIQR